MQTYIDQPFGDGVYRFALPMAALCNLEDLRGVRIGVIYRRTVAALYQNDGHAVINWLEADFSVSDIKHICHQALIHGNRGEVDGRVIEVPDRKATELCKAYLYPESGNPITRMWELAAAIIVATVRGYEPAISEAEKKSPKRSRRTVKADTTAARSSATVS